MPAAGAGQWMLSPNPVTTTPADDSARMPPSLALVVGSTTSLGHLSAVPTPVTSSTAATAASPAASVMRGHCSVGQPGRKASDAASARGAATHSRPLLPRPWVCRAATTSSAPGRSPSRERASSWVESTEPRVTVS